MSALTLPCLLALAALGGLLGLLVVWMIRDEDAGMGSALECPRCGCTNVWYDDGYWRCDGCGLEWPDQEGHS